MKAPSLALLAALMFGVATIGCGSDSNELSVEPPDAGRDSGQDASPYDAATDAGRDSGQDASPHDAASDAALDSGHDAASDAAIDASSDATSDAAIDASSDAASDAAIDASSDAASDAAIDAASDAAATDGGQDAATSATADAGVSLCANADLVTGDIHANYTMGAAATNAFTSGVGCALTTWADHVFAVDVPAGKRLYSSVRGVGAYDPSISLLDGALTCVATGGTCLAGDDTGTAQSLDAVTRTNTGATTKRYFIVVDSTTNALGDYDFRTVVTDPLVGDTCATASPITLAGGNGTRSGDTVEFYANDYATGTGCSGFGGGERVYRIDVPASTTLAITATPAATFDASLNVIEGAAGASPETACAAATSCAASANAGVSGEAERLTYQNNTLAVKTIFVTVEAATSLTVPGSFDLSVRTIVAPPGDTCDSPPEVAFTNGSATIIGDTLVDALNDYGAGLGCAGTLGADRGYAVTIPAGKRLTVTAAATGASPFNPSLNIVAASTCSATPRECLAGSDIAGPGETLTYANTSGADANVVVFVETSAATVFAPGTYDLAFSLSDPPMGDTCSLAPVIGSGTLLGQTLVGFANDYHDGLLCESDGGPDRLYRVAVPNGQRITARVTPDVAAGPAAWDPSLNLQVAEACVDVGRECLVGSDASGNGGSEAAAWVNRTGASVDVFVVVETFESPPPGLALLFTLDVSVDTPPPTPTGDVCATATTVTAGTLQGQSLLEYANDYGTGAGCEGTGGPDRLYKIIVPAGQRLEATVTPLAPGGGGPEWDPSINLQSEASCGAATRSCIGRGDYASYGETETALWMNSGATPVTLYVVVETFLDGVPPVGDARAFDITFTLTSPQPPPADDVCSDTAPVYADSSTLEGESLDDYTGTYAAGTATCATVSNTQGGIDRAYRIRIDAGRTLTATLTPNRYWDPTLSLVIGTASACTTAPLVCTTGSNLGALGEGESLTYTNITGASVDAFLIVDSFAPPNLTTFPYNLDLTFTP